MKRADRLREVAAHVQAAPILLEGDAEELLGILEAGAAASNIALTRDGHPDAPSRVVILAVEGGGRRSAFIKASRMLREVDKVLAKDAVRIVVIRSDRSRKLPDRLEPLLASEILFQVTLALIPEQGARRSFRQLLGLRALEAVGLRILRFG